MASSKYGVSDAPRTVSEDTSSGSLIGHGIGEEEAQKQARGDARESLRLTDDGQVREGDIREEEHVEGVDELHDEEEANTNVDSGASSAVVVDQGDLLGAKEIFSSAPTMVELNPSGKLISEVDYDTAWSSLMTKVAQRSSAVGGVPLKKRSPNFSLQIYFQEVARREAQLGGGDASAFGDTLEEAYMAAIEASGFTSHVNASSGAGTGSDSGSGTAVRTALKDRELTLAMEHYIRSVQLARFRSRRAQKQAVREFY